MHVCSSPTRFSTLAVVYPSKRCPKCNNPSKTFKPASMGAPRKVDPLVGSKVAGKENFRARGVEHAFSLKS